MCTGVGRIMMPLRKDNVMSKESVEKQASLWGARAEDWAQVQEGLVRPLFEAVAQRCEVHAGMRVLDVGCGAGGFVQLATSRGATTTGMDATPELLAIARRRTPAARFDPGDLESLPYDDASFDLVTGFNSFQYAADPVQGLREARRVVRKGGHVVIATWGKPEDCEGAAYLAALKPLLPPPPPGAGGPFALSDEAALRAIVEKAGLGSGAVVDVSCPWEYPDLSVALRGLLSSGPVVLAIRTTGEEKVRAATTEAIAPFRTSSGGYRIENKFRYLIAER
jgi:SAM-dependent methyltransferase